MRKWRKGYAVTEDGRIWSDRLGRVLHGAAVGRGYIVVHLSIGRFYVHRIVCEVFHGPSRGRVVNHKNGDRSDNHPQNLEWCTQAENLRHAREILGRHGGTRGEARPAAKLTEQDVLNIRLRYEAGETHRELAADYGIAIGNVGAITRGDAWKHVPGPVRRRKRRTPFRT